MKKFLLSITAVLAVGFINAQIYSASDSVEFSAWTPYDNDGDAVNWFNLDIAATSVTDAAMIAQGETISSASWNGAALTPDNLIASPAIDCSSSGTIFVNWVTFSPEGGTSTFFAEKYAVYVATQAQLAAIVATSVYPPAVFEETLAEGGVILGRSIDVSAIAGSQSAVHIVIRHYDCTDQNWISIDDVSVTTQSTSGLEEITTAATVYPNPASDILNIETTNAANSVAIISMDGKVVSTTAISGLNGSVDVSNLTEGVYFYEVAIADGSVIRNTFVKK